MSRSVHVQPRGQAPVPARTVRVGTTGPDTRTLDEQIAERAFMRTVHVETSAVEAARLAAMERVLEAMEEHKVVGERSMRAELAAAWREQRAQKDLTTTWDLERPDRLKLEAPPRNPAPAWVTGELGHTSSMQTLACELKEDPAIRARGHATVRAGIAVSKAEKALAATAAREDAAVAAAAQAAMRRAIAGMEDAIAGNVRAMADTYARENKALALEAKMLADDAAQVAIRQRQAAEAESKATDEVILARVYEEKEAYAKVRREAAASGRPGTAPALMAASRRSGGAAKSLTTTVANLCLRDALDAQAGEKGLKRRSEAEEKAVREEHELALEAAALALARDSVEMEKGFRRAHFAEVEVQRLEDRRRKEEEREEARRPQNPWSQGTIAQFGRHFR
jgi:hypothetical protein